MNIKKKVSQYIELEQQIGKELEALVGYGEECNCCVCELLRLDNEYLCINCGGYSNKESNQ